MIEFSFLTFYSRFLQCLTINIALPLSGCTSIALIISNADFRFGAINIDSELNR